MDIVFSKCNECDFNGSEEDIRNHTLNEHRKSFKCNKCVDVFQTNEDLDNHITSSHSPFSCEFCDLALSSVSFLQEHLIFFSLRAAQQPELYLFKNNGKILDFMLRGPVKVTKPSIITNT